MPGPSLLIISAETTDPMARRLKELWDYRELFWTFVQRDIKVRYKQAALGVAWAFVQPLLSMVVFTIFVGRLAGVGTKSELPYPLFAYAGLLPWQLFAYSLTQASNSVVAEQRLITKVYFPRLLIPCAPVVSGLVDFGVGLLGLLLLMIHYGVRPGWAVVTVPLFVGLAALTSLAVGLWCSALNALYRDIRHTVPFLIQVWLFLSPVIYPSSLVPEPWRAWYGLNPMASAIDGFRWALLGSGPPRAPQFACSLVVVLALLIGGLRHFRRVERSLADVV